jgi:ribonuclease Z
MPFSITVLGSSAATPTSRRNPTSILVNLDFNYYLMDCGEGTQLQLRKLKFKIQRLKKVFISHLHGDHFFGLIGLISTLHLLGRKDDFDVYGPPPLEEIINIQLEASQTQLSFPLNFFPTNSNQPEIVFENEHHIIKSFPLDHRIPTTGFHFAEKQKPRKLKKKFLFFENIEIEDIKKIKDGQDFVSNSGKVYPNREITETPPKAKSFAFCSDTRYNEAIIPNIKNVNLLYHEATFMEDMKQAATEKYHSTAAQAATIAMKAKADKLLVGHFSARYRELEKLLEEARNKFPNTQLAEDCKFYEV